MRSEANRLKARQYFGILDNPNLVLHHKDSSWQYEDPERYNQWNPEDLIVMTNEEHSRLHWKLNNPAQTHRETNNFVANNPMNDKESEGYKNFIQAVKSEEFKEKLRQWHLEHPQETSEETRQKLRENRLGGHWYTNGVDNRFITDEKDIPEGFYRGMRYKKGEAHG